MQVAVFPTAGSVPPLAAYAGWQPVAIDVLRATTTIITALEHGAAAVIPCTEPEAARQVAAAIPGARLGGERHNVRLPGFHFGNSPAEYTPEAVAGRTVCFTTSNGTRAIAAVAPLGPVLIAALLNASAVARQLAASGRSALIICAGSDGELCLEDTVCAGAIAEALGPAAELNDMAWLARALFRTHRSDLPGLLRSARHGQRLLAQGFGPDLERCAALDATDRVPAFSGGAIR